MENSYKDKSGNIRELASLDYNDLSEYLQDVHPQISKDAPNIAPHVFMATNSAIAYLNSKLPPFGSELPLDEVVEPAKAEQKRWMEIYDTLNDPLSIIKATQDRTLTDEQLDAVKAVYPDIYGEIALKVQTKISEIMEKGETIPYAKRVALGKLLGLPLDATMTTQSMQAVLMSASPNMGPEAQEMQQQKLSGPQITQMNKTNSLYKTPSQARDQQK